MASLLQLTFCIGGLGYAFRREWRYAAATFFAVLLMEGLLGWAEASGLRPLAVPAALAVFTIQVSTALDVLRREPLRN